MIAAVIPTRYRPPEFGVLVEQLQADGVHVFAIDSDSFNHRIYAMWNEGVRLARAAGADTIAVLNDDIAILPGTLPLMATVLRSEPDLGVVYPDVNAPWELPRVPLLQDTEGSWGAGGMTGFAFMFKAETAIPFDEGYHWWYGDDAWERDVRAAAYRVARVRGLPIRHTPNGSARQDWARLAPLIEQDRARFEGRAA